MKRTIIMGALVTMMAMTLPTSMSAKGIDSSQGENAANAVKVASGEWCSYGGTTYQWDRIVRADGSVVIAMTPIGSCIP